MPAPDPTSILFTIAHPDLYERNPFNVLNLSVNATAKDIRRRREDIEAAFDAGTEADEFAGMIPADEGRTPPTREVVHDLFAALDVPEKRIAYALFWFWPAESESASGARASRSRDPNAAFRNTKSVGDWEKRALGASRSESVVERHNLAVYCHLMALSGERSSKQRVAQQASDTVDRCWREAIRWWNDIAAEPDLWHSVSELVSSLGDPRLDYRFARSLRDQFAYAFDQINVELAIDYAKTGREADAKRQVAYMKLSQPDSDDVEGTFDDAFSGLLKQTEAVVDTALAETKANPKDGLKQANAILSQTSEPLSVSRIVLNMGSPVRESIVTTIFNGVRDCLIIYGNATKDWSGCLELLNELKVIAETGEQEGFVSNDIALISKNKLIQEEGNRCWFCKSPKTCAIDVPMYGDVTRNSSKVQWKSITATIPTCAKCRKKWNSTDGKIGCSFPIIGAFIGSVFGNVFGNPNGDAVIDGLLIGGILGLIAGVFISANKSWDSMKIHENPLVQELKKKGYEVGAKPPNVR